MNAIETIRARLFAMQDLEYRDFSSALIPTVDRSRVIGVRTPALRKYAAELAGSPEAQEFLACLPHEYYEENNLHAFLIEKIRDYGACIAALDAFLPYVDNWATCDSMCPKLLGRHLPELLKDIRRWLDSGQTYVVRYGVGMLMRWYLDEAFSPEYLEMVAALRSEEYYIRMMVAWYFATALAKQWDAALPFIEERRLDVWIHNKAVQKAIESRRISDTQKAYLRSLKIR